jgi:hypothetical protein
MHSTQDFFTQQQIDAPCFAPFGYSGAFSGCFAMFHKRSSFN